MNIISCIKIKLCLGINIIVKNRNKSKIFKKIKFNHSPCTYIVKI